MDGSDNEARQLVERIWAETAAAQQVGPEPLPDFEALLDDADRRYLNDHAVVARSFPDGDPASRKTDLRQRLGGQVARLVASVLDHHLADEEEFRGHLIRLQNSLTVGHDRVSAEVRRVEADLVREVERREEGTARLEQRVADLERKIERLTEIVAGQGP